LLRTRAWGSGYWCCNARTRSRARAMQIGSDTPTEKFRTWKLNDH
jgi:hypothetical protein